MQINKHDVDIVDKEKSLPQAIEIGDSSVVGMTQDEVDFYIDFPEGRRKKLYHKVDVRLIPVLAILYLTSHLDRSNIGNAKIEGMLPDLKMSGLQYNTVTSIFFVPYVLLAVPSNIVLKKIARPSFYIGSLVTAWGVVMTCHGVVQNFGGLVAVRILLGIFEAGFFPGAIYLASYWYPPKALAARVSYFYCTSSLSSAFSGLLAAAIAQMDGLGNYRGWRWIFIIEGLASVVLGVACFFLLIDTPSTSGRWLKPDEARYLETAMLIKQGGRVEDDPGFKLRDLRIVATNWRISAQAYFLFCQSALSYGINFTLPTIVKAMGFENTSAQLLSAPPYVLASFAVLISARLSDHLYWRMPFISVPLVMITISYSVIISLHGNLQGNIGLTYAFICISVGFMYTILSSGVSWNANNLAPAPRRAVGIALSNCTGNIGGILGSFMYLQREKPEYPTGFGISLALGVSGLLLTFFVEWTYLRGNKKKAKVVDEARTKYTPEELFDMGDKSPLFKYTL